ncbi:MAG TPA: DNA-formamidopyrimidine glycosylase family protein [Vicinamibacterales bacterium]|nr:DNA-formamidopyrimidine glycosylase family protein [Vicinamibacterales bacterium]
MPEYPDIELYLHALAPRVSGQPLTRIRLASPFLVRSIDPPLETCAGRRVVGLRRLGKRVVFELDAEYFLIIHLMIAGRFRWREVGAKVPGKVGLAALDFPSGTLLLTEAGSQRQASLHAVRGAAALAAHDPGGADVFTLTLDEFDRQLRRENHTLKRALTDPRLFSGIGNAYSDEILLAARLSPLQLTSRLEPSAAARLFDITRTVLRAWKDRLIQETGGDFPEKVTAFREGMAAHGRYGLPCPVCGTSIQRIRYASNEANYCPTCQTGGRLLADRGLSRLLKGDWPRTLEELERRKAGP